MPTIDQTNICSSRESLTSVIDRKIQEGIRNQATLLSLKNYFTHHPPSKEVEEYLWSLLAYNR